MQSDNPTPVDRKDQPKPADANVEPPRAAPSQTAAESERTINEPEKTATETKKEKKAQFVIATSILNLFKEYKGERKGLLALFAAPAKGYTQQPPIFLVDGKSTLKITIPVDASASASPNFAISKEAQMASFPKIVEDNWVVELKPKKGVYQATLSYFLDDVTTDIPLTVAPLLETYNGKPFNKLTESDLIQFLTRPEAAKPDLSQDLNGDKLVDYIDDYIFIANYLVQAPQTKAAPTKSDVKTQPKKEAVEKPVQKTVK
jgi:hypothetical protein